jgi:hypothetical protein
MFCTTQLAGLLSPTRTLFFRQGTARHGKACLGTNSVQEALLHSNSSKHPASTPGRQINAWLAIQRCMAHVAVRVRKQLCTTPVRDIKRRLLRLGASTFDVRIHPAFILSNLQPPTSIATEGTTSDDAKTKLKGSNAQAKHPPDYDLCCRYKLGED